MPIDATKDKDIEFALKTYDFVKLEHLEVDELVEKHSLFLKAVDCKVFLIRSYCQNRRASNPQGEADADGPGLQAN